jgi:hypothetical protein
MEYFRGPPADSYPPALECARGESIGIVTVPENDIEPLRANEILSVRRLAVA